MASQLLRCRGGRRGRHGCSRKAEGSPWKLWSASAVNGSTQRPSGDSMQVLGRDDFRCSWVKSSSLDECCWPTAAQLFCHGSQACLLYAMTFWLLGSLLAASSSSPEQSVFSFQDLARHSDYACESMASRSAVAAGCMQELPAGVDTVVLDLKSCMVDIVPMAGFLVAQIRFNNMAPSHKSMLFTQTRMQAGEKIFRLAFARKQDAHR